MKELSIEEKSKRYDEALERAKDFQKVNGAAGSAVISEIFPELAEKEDKDEKIRKNCIHFLELQKSHHAATFEIEECIDWLEKQGKQEQLYIRFGEIPTGEKSKIYQGEIEIGIENGVSVYPAFKTNEGNIVLGLNLPITKTTLHTQQYLIEYDSRPCYLVKGDYIGKDTDGQPLINNITIIKKIDNYRVKEKKIGNVDNQNYIKPANIDKSKFREDNWFEKQGEKPQGKSIIEVWKDMRCEVYAQASGNRHEPNCSDNNTEMFSLNDIDEIIEKVATGSVG